MNEQRGGRWAAVLPIAFLVAGLAMGTRAEDGSHVRIVQLSLMTGAVEINLPDGHGWRPALLDAPLIQGEQVRTLASGRAEIELEGGSTVRLIPNSQLTLTTLSLDSSGSFTTIAKLAQGTAFVTLRKEDSKAFRLELPAGAVVPQGQASFRAEAAAPRVQVFDGKAEIEAGAQRATLKKDQEANLATAPLSAAVLDSHPDPWTQWSRTRDQYYEAALHQGIQAGGLISYVNWYDTTPASGAAPPVYSGTGLAYLGGSGCPWTVTRGDYAGWCWSEDQGWYRPATAPAVTAAAVANASDVAQTNAHLAEAAEANNQNAAAGAYGYNALGMFAPGMYTMSGLFLNSGGLYPCSPFSEPFDPLFDPTLWTGGVGSPLLFNGFFNSFYGGPGIYGGLAGGCPSIANGWIAAPTGGGGGGVAAVPGTLGAPPRILGRPGAPGERFTPVGSGVHGGVHRLGPPPGFAHRGGVVPASGLQVSRTSFGRQNFSGSVRPLAGDRPVFAPTGGGNPAFAHSGGAVGGGGGRPEPRSGFSGGGGMSAVGHASAPAPAGNSGGGARGGAPAPSGGSSGGHTGH